MAAFQSPVTCQNTVGFENVFEAVQKLQSATLKPDIQSQTSTLELHPELGRENEQKWNGL